MRTFLAILAILMALLNLFVGILALIGGNWILVGLFIGFGFFGFVIMSANCFADACEHRERKAERERERWNW